MAISKTVLSDGQTVLSDSKTVLSNSKTVLRDSKTVLSNSKAVLSGSKAGLSDSKTAHRGISLASTKGLAAFGGRAFQETTETIPEVMRSTP